jgi:curved DNA-binding protein CbpA
MVLCKGAALLHTRRRSVVTLDEALRILGLTHTSLSKESLAAAYRAKTKQYHPDVGGSAEEMVRLNRAREVAEEALKMGSDWLRAFQALDEQLRQWTGGVPFDEWLRRMEEERRKQEERWRREEEEKRRREELRKRYAEGLRKAYLADLKAFRKLLKELAEKHEGNPALYQAMLDVLEAARYRGFGKKNPYREYEARYAARRRFEEIYADDSTYQARFRKRKDGTTAGPYWYRVRRQGSSVRYEYVGRRLPESAMEEPNAEKRRAKCMEEARWWVKENLGL